MREYAINQNWVSKDVDKTVENFEYYFYFNQGIGLSSHWIYTNPEARPGAPEAEILIDGIKVKNHGFCNADFQFRHFRENNTCIGDCGDETVFINAWCKAVGIASNAFMRREERFNNPAEILGHAFTIYYEPATKVWKAYEPQATKVYPRPLSEISLRPVYIYIWLMPVRQTDFLKIWNVNDKGIWDGNMVFMRKTTYGRMAEMLAEGIPASEMKQWLLYSEKKMVTNEQS